jgi:hypothetical protein
LRTRVSLAFTVCVAQFVFLAGPPGASHGIRANGSQVNGPTSLAVDSQGRLLLIESGENKVRRLDLRTGKIVTVAGNGKKCCYREGAKATQVSLSFLRSLAVDSEGNVFIGDGEQIKEIDGNTGLISTIAGDGTGGATVDGMSARSAHFWGIESLALDRNEDLFVVDQTQRKIFVMDRKSGTVHRYAGSGKFGFAGDGGLAVDASFRFPTGLATDGAGNLTIADFENCAIRRIDRGTGVIMTIAITGGVEQNCIEKPNNSRPGAFPSDTAVDPAGNIYYVEGAMDLVFRIDAKTSVISAFAGSGQRGFAGDDGPATKARLADPSGLAIDMEGNVFIADDMNNRVRRVDAKTGVITTVLGNGLPVRVYEQL